MITDNKNNLIVPYGNYKETVDLIKKYGPTKILIRQIQKYSVSIRDTEYNNLQTSGKIDQIMSVNGPTQLFILNDNNEYDDAGLRVLS